MTFSGPIEDHIDFKMLIIQYFCYSKSSLYWIGVVSFAFSIILGITSLPSVAASLSWKEFAFVQSKLGWVCLLFAVAHDIFYGWPYFFTTTCYLPPTFNVSIRIGIYIFNSTILLNLSSSSQLRFHIFISVYFIFALTCRCDEDHFDHALCWHEANADKRRLGEET